MNATVPYSIPRESGALPAILLAIAVHMALFAFLWFGIRWQNDVPVAMEAEVWDITPSEAAPPPRPEPEPVAVKEAPKPVEQPVEKPIQKPDIALEQEKKRKELEQKQHEQEEQQKKADAEARKKQELRDEALREKARKEAMSRMLAQAGAGNAAKSQGPRGDPDYMARIVAKIRSNTYFPTPPDLAGNPTVEYELGLLPDGSLMGVRLIKSSGLPGFDEAVRRGIQNSEPFPADKSGVVPRDLIVVYQLKEKS